jgi:hypothetical protein
VLTAPLPRVQMQLGGWDKSAQLAGQKRLASGMMVGGAGRGGMGMVPSGQMGGMGSMMAMDNKRPKVEGDKSILAKVCRWRAAGPLLGRCWAAAGPLLGRCWAAAGPLLGRCWAAAGLLPRCLGGCRLGPAALQGGPAGGPPP